MPEVASQLDLRQDGYPAVLTSSCETCKCGQFLWPVAEAEARGTLWLAWERANVMSGMASEDCRETAERKIQTLVLQLQGSNSADIQGAWRRRLSPRREPQPPSRESLSRVTPWFRPAEAVRSLRCAGPHH